MSTSVKFNGHSLSEPSDIKLSVQGDASGTFVAGMDPSNRSQYIQFNFGDGYQVRWAVQLDGDQVALRIFTRASSSDSWVSKKSL